MESAFQAIQEFTGFIAPGIVAVFLMGMFYKRTNSVGAFAMLAVTLIASYGLKMFMPDFPFVNRVWITFLSCLAVGALVSHVTAMPKDSQPVILGDIDFKTTKSFNIWIIIIAIILAGLYVIFW